MRHRHPGPGLADPVFRFVLHLAGGPALVPQQFVKAKKSTLVGVSVTVAAPLGQYYPTKLVNIGTNRWAFKPELAVSVPARRWLFDAYAAVWTFTTNDASYPGTQVKEQDPIVALQAHVSYNLALRAWAAFDATWYGGGHTTTNGVPRPDRQNNSRLGATVSVPLGRRYSLKAAYSWDLSTAASTGFNTFSIGWNAAWFAPRVWP